MPDSIPAIVDKDLFEEVQQKSRRTAALLPVHQGRGRLSAHRKLFCGMCGFDDVRRVRHRPEQVVHHYYKLRHREAFKTCQKKTVRKEWLEDLVIAETIEADSGRCRD